MNKKDSKVIKLQREFESLLDNTEYQIMRCVKCKNGVLTLRVGEKEVKVDVAETGYRIEKAFCCLTVEVDREKKVISIPYTKKERKAALKRKDNKVLGYPHRWSQIEQGLKLNRKAIFKHTGLSNADIENLLTLVHGYTVYEQEQEENVGIATADISLP